MLHHWELGSLEISSLSKSLVKDTSSLSKCSVKVTSQDAGFFFQEHRIGVNGDEMFTPPRRYHWYCSWNVSSTARRPSLPPPLRIKDLINLQLEEPDRIPYVCSSYLSVPPSLLLGCLVPGSLQPHAVAQVSMDTP